MVNLGQTSSPVDLIPGNPGAIAQVMTQLYDYGALLTEAGNGLSRLDTSSGWSGAAADAFRKRFTGQPEKWQQAGSCFTTAAAALEEYIPTLIWAQNAAAAAIRMWAQGDKKGASSTLASARSQVESAAGKANTVVGAARDKAPPHPGFWSKVGGFFSDVGHDIVHGGEDAGNILASLGNAAIHDPGADLSILGGLGLAGISAGGEVLGTAADATGVGAVVGVPVNVLSATGIAAGGTLAMAGAGDLGSHAAGDDQAHPFGDGGSGGGGDPDAPGQAQNVLGKIDDGDWPPKGVKGGGSFSNDGRPGGEVLPTTDANGNPVTYQEWDLNPKGPHGRDAIRIVTGSDGSAYYTDDHYNTFTKMR